MTLSDEVTFWMGWLNGSTTNRIEQWNLVDSLFSHTSLGHCDVECGTVDILSLQEPSFILWI